MAPEPPPPRTHSITYPAPKVSPNGSLPCPLTIHFIWGVDAGGMDITDLPVKYDEKYAERLSRMSWQRSVHGYARHCRSEGGKTRWVSMHRLVWEWEYGSVPRYLDHINGDRMDNRLCNLRPATLSLNAHNTRRRIRESLPAGVFRTRGSGVSPYGACISHHNKTRYLGVFATVEEAEAVYREARRLVMEHESAVACGAEPGEVRLPVFSRARGRPKRTDVAEAKALWDAGLAGTQIAKQLGCCSDTARRLLREAGVALKRGPRKKRPSPPVGGC